MTEQTQTDERSALKKYLATGKHWPILLVVLFVSQASIVLGTAVIASGRGSKPLDDGYYARSLNWDTERAALTRADELGWSITVTAGPPQGVYKQRLLSISLVDQAGLPISDAAVQVRTFHRARSDVKIEEVMPMSDPGVYSKELRMSKPGLWDVQISIRAMGEDILANELIEVGG